MAGPVLSISTNKQGSNLCIRVWNPRLGYLETQGYGCVDKTTFKCHHTHLKCLAFRGGHPAFLLGNHSPATLLPNSTSSQLHPLPLVPNQHFSGLGSRMMTNSQKQTCPCGSKAPHTAGWRNGSGIVVMCTTMEVCCPALELERLRSDCTASWGQMEGEKRNPSAWLMGSETDQSITGILCFTFRKGHPSPQKAKEFSFTLPIDSLFCLLGKTLRTFSTLPNWKPEVLKWFAISLPYSAHL